MNAKDVIGIQGVAGIALGGAVAAGTIAAAPAVAAGALLVIGGIAASYVIDKTKVWAKEHLGEGT